VRQTTVAVGYQPAYCLVGLWAWAAAQWPLVVRQAQADAASGQDDGQHGYGVEQKHHAHRADRLPSILEQKEVVEDVVVDHAAGASAQQAEATPLVGDAR